jgi:hypothetical protein
MRLSSPIANIFENIDQKQALAFMLVVDILVGFVGKVTAIYAALPCTIV